LGAHAGLNLRDWIADRMQEGKIQIIAYPKNTPLNKTLSKFGMELSDRIYVFVAVADRSKMIVTDDIDFHNPKMKNAAGQKKAALKAAKSGPVCNYLRQNHGIKVGHLTEVQSSIP
jgi:hypothetical protein